MPTPRVLTFNFHEPYICLMAKTGLPLTVGLYERPPFAREWQTKFRPVPKNVTLVPESVWRRDLNAGGFDVVVAHNEMNAANVLGCPVPGILVCHNRRSFLETTVAGDPAQGRDAYRRLLSRLRERFEFVFISESKRDDYGIPGAVVLPGIDVDEYGGYSGDIAKVLRVGNAMRSRNRMFDVDFQERVCDGVPNRIVGEDTLMPDARPSASFDDLLENYRRLRCLLHVTREEYEDGYNLAMLEAMAVGMPVVSLTNRTSPLTNGVDGFLSGRSEELRQHIQTLLDDRDLAIEIGARGRDTVARKFPLTRFVEKWNEILHTAADRRPSRVVATTGASLGAFPRVKVMAQYCASPFSTARYFEQALRQDQELITIGSQIPTELINEWGFVGKPPPVRRQDLPLGAREPIADALRALPRNFNPLCYLWIDSGVDDLPPDLESLSLPKICYLIDTHCAFQTRAAIARRFQFTFLAQKTRLEDFARAGVPNVAWLPLGCSPELHDVGPMPRIHDVAFVGALPHDPDDRRRRLLDAVAARFPNHRIGRFWPEEMARIYAQSRIVVNVSAARDVNMRVFEALASGALLITDPADGLEELFRDGEHLVVYRDDAELVPLIEKYLADHAERERIAAAGRALVLSEHTYRHRARRMMMMVLEALGALGGASGESRFNRGGYYRSPRPELAAHVPMRAQRILDVGCGGGEFGLALKRRGAREVVGIEIVERAYEFARQVLDRAILGNLEQMELPFDDEYFDCIVCGDVLEHLVDPTAALRKLARVLARDGVIVMSIPNVRFWQTVLMHANGRWLYEDAGIMDRTHLRFFCAPDMAQMVLDAGLELVRIQPLSMWPAAELPLDKDGCLKLGRLTIGPLSEAEHQDFLVYQYLVVAARPGMDRLVDARFALESQDYQSAYQLADQAAGADDVERKRIMAKAMGRAGKLDRAEELYREALKISPENSSLQSELGIVLVAAGKYDESRPLLDRALCADPEDDRALGALGLIAFAQGDYLAAMVYFRHALSVRIDNAPIAMRLMDCAQELGDPRAAFGPVRRFVEHFPGNIDVSCRYAELLAQAGEIGEARDRLQTLMLLWPENEKVRGTAATLGLA
ncbi:MAG: hypothetical protein AMXMBFR4_20610 [Candidatus Hydrogenedentota bacterium]